MGLSVRELKAELTSRGIDVSHCCEKCELQQLLDSSSKAKAQEPQNCSEQDNTTSSKYNIQDESFAALSSNVEFVDGDDACHWGEQENAMSTTPKRKALVRESGDGSSEKPEKRRKMVGSTTIVVEDIALRQFTLLSRNAGSLRRGIVGRRLAQGLTNEDDEYIDLLRMNKGFVHMSPFGGKLLLGSAVMAQSEVLWIMFQGNRIGYVVMRNIQHDVIANNPDAPPEIARYAKCVPSVLMCLQQIYVEPCYQHRGVATAVLSKILGKNPSAIVESPSRTTMKLLEELDFAFAGARGLAEGFLALYVLRSAAARFVGSSDINAVDTDRACDMDSSNTDFARMRNLPQKPSIAPQRCCEDNIRSKVDFLLSALRNCSPR